MPLFRKIFIGLEDIASMVEEFAIGFKALGLDVFSAVYKQAPICSSHCDIVISDLLPPVRPHMSQEQLRSYHEQRQRIAGKIFDKAVRECDAFLFFWSTFTADFSDLARLKSLGKTIIFAFMGSDCRWANAYNQDVARYGLDPLPPGMNANPAVLPEILLRLRMVEKFADAVFSTPSMAQLALRPYYNCLAYPLHMAPYDASAPQRAVPVILHAPSNRLVKGSDAIEGIFTRLTEEGMRFVPRIIEGMPHEQAVLAYRDVDMLAGQLGSTTGGRQERELMACGKVVVTGIRPDEYPQKLAEDYPNVPGHTPEAMYAALKRLIPDRGARQAIGSLGPAFVRRHHDPPRACLRYLEAAVGGTPPDFDPVFFRESYVPEPEHLSLYNAATRLVADCAWYKRQVVPGERAGLLF